MILGTLIDDLMLRIYGGSVSDDAHVEREQVQHLLVTKRDELVKTYLDTLISAGKPMDTYYKTREILLVSSEDESEVEQADERIYVTLSKQPMSLINDLGIIKLTTDDGVYIHRSRLEMNDIVKDLPYAKPTTIHPVFYRDSRKVIIDGLSYKNIDRTEVIVDYIPTASSQTLAETDELVVSDELLPVLLDSVEEILLREVGSQTDLQNNGIDE